MTMEILLDIKKPVDNNECNYDKDTACCNNLFMQDYHV